ncbi:hypothetical protein [Yimella sp. cx-51]|uniref:hypothetical protein n=1 Tax=Yimella sp. cx-51 TaxID=2770551 RepID=UPI00165DC329|nr:hypothetical protein [Yimella sp. cx-51]MBC9957832.1 hypothetical protein [Yimella sp. cx-51]QTH37974.1 hypothetical protein J5M86_14240 [Yimella sp. cx-51]
MLAELERALATWRRTSELSEHIALQVLHAEGYTEVKPGQPHGGPDGGLDGTFLAAGRPGGMAAYFPRDAVGRSRVTKKFEGDLAKAVQRHVAVFAFVTNQRMSVAVRRKLETLGEEAGVEVDLVDLDRLVMIFSRPAMHPLAAQFLGVRPDAWPDEALRDIAAVADQHGAVDFHLGLKSQAFVWPGYLQVPEHGREIGIALLRAGQVLTDVIPAQVIDPSRSETDIVVVCADGVELQDVGDALAELARQRGFEVSTFGSRGLRSVSVWACGPRYADIRQCFQSLINGARPGGVGFPGCAAWELTSLKREMLPS